MNVKFTINRKNLDAVEDIAAKALIRTAREVRRDILKEKTMPFDTGNLQNRSTFVDESQAKDFKVSIVSDTPYARRLYFHPEYNFSRAKNKAAGGEWFEPYLNGAKKDYAQRMFEKFLSSGMKRLGG